MATALRALAAALVLVSAPWLYAQEQIPQPPAVPVVQQVPVPVAVGPTDLSPLATLDQVITVDFADVDLVDAINFLRKITSLTIVIDPKVVAGGPPPVTLRGEQMQVGSVLYYIAKLTGLAWSRRDDALFLVIADAQAAPKEMVAPAVLPPLATLDQEFTFDFQDTSLVDVLVALQRTTKLNFVLDPRVLAAGCPSITLRVEQMKARLILDFIGRLTDLVWVYDHEALFLTLGQVKPAAPAAAAPAVAAPAVPAPLPAPVRKGADDF